MADVFGAEFRRVEDREHLGKPALVIVAIRNYDTTVEDLWEAITTPARIARWFGSVEGELRLGGRYQIKGNAGGSITRCERPEAVDVTWEYMDTTSWVTARLAPDGRRARLTLEHIAHKDGTGDAAEFFKNFGPAAGGVGWDLWLHGLGRHLADPAASLDHEAFDAWASSTDEGKAFVRVSGEAWGAADAASGEDPDEARARAERTIAFYTGA
jgi:uncharacterized protein YndB with AHSA1/START domain